LSPLSHSSSVRGCCAMSRCRPGCPTLCAVRICFFPFRPNDNAQGVCPMTQNYIDLDVRPILRNGGEPFAEIMKAVSSLAPDQGLRLYATFKPVPLFQVLGKKGYSHAEKEIGGGDWEILFQPAKTGQQPAQNAKAAPDT